MTNQKEKITLSAIRREDDKNPYIAVLLSQEEFKEIKKAINMLYMQRDSNLKSVRRSRGESTSNLPVRQFIMRYDPSISTLKVADDVKKEDPVKQ